MREERGFSFSPALAGGFDGSGASGSMEEPPPWDDAALDAQAAAMEIPGAAPVASAPAPKPKPKAAPAPKPAYTPPPKPDSRYPAVSYTHLDVYKRQVLRICSSRRLGNCLLQPGCVSGAGGWIIRDSHRTKEKGIK